MSIPDITLSTACFNLRRFHGGCLDIDAILKRFDGVLQLPVYLVIYTEPSLHAAIKEKRTSHGLDHLTHYVVTEFEDLWCAQYIPIVKANRAVYWPTRDERTCAESHLLMFNKADFVLQTINADPFKTSKFAWIDSFLTLNNSQIRICEDYNVSKMLYTLNNITDKFHIQVLNVNDKRFKKPEHKREYYQQYRYVVCGTFFATGRTIGIKVLERFKELAVETTHAGYGHADEMIFLEILDEFYDDIHHCYGDYGQIINNMIEPTRNLGYVYDMIVARYMNFGYNRECYDSASALVRSFESYRVSMDWGLYAKSLFAAYIGAYYSQPHDVTLAIAARINNLYSENPYFKAAYKHVGGGGAFYDSQLQYAEYLRPHYKVVACVFGCPTIDRYKAEIKKIEATWGSRMKTVFFFGEERVADFTGADHVYLPKVANDYQSASYKQHLGLKYIYEHYNADFVFVCGSDTYVNVPNLTSYIASMDPSKPAYIGGHGMTTQVGPESIYFHSGGAGFLLSRAALRMIYRDLGSMTDQWIKYCSENGVLNFRNACDITIAYYLQKMGGCETIKFPLFIGCNHRGYTANYSYRCCGTSVPPIKDIITCHSMSLLDFDEIEEIISYNSQIQPVEYVRPHYKVVACVFACPTVDRYKAEVKKIEATWGARMKTVFFFGEERVADFTGADHVYLPKVANDYQSASYKQELGLKYIYEHYNADFVFVCGTDTYVNVSNLTTYIASMDPSKPTYSGGHGATVNVGPESVYYHSGGAGFVLSRAALEMIYKDLGSMTDQWLKLCDVVGTWYFKPSCDVTIAYYLQKMGDCETIKSAQFIGCNHRGYANNYATKCCADNIPPIKDLITCHNMNLLDFDEIEEILGEKV